MTFARDSLNLLRSAFKLKRDPSHWKPVSINFQMCNPLIARVDRFGYNILQTFRYEEMRSLSQWYLEGRNGHEGETRCVPRALFHLRLMRHPFRERRLFRPFRRPNLLSAALRKPEPPRMLRTSRTGATQSGTDLGLRQWPLSEG